MVRIIRGEKAGFCMGVALALRKLDDAVARFPRGLVATMGPIIHNPQVLQEYEKMGVVRLSVPEQTTEHMVVLIRAHGIPRNEEERLSREGTTVIDATCPKVKRAQLAIARSTERGETLLLYGEGDHPEVRGLVSYAKGPCHVFSNEGDLRSFFSSGRPEGREFVLAAQTTQDRRKFNDLRRYVDSMTPSGLRVLDTICDATRERQAETISLAGQVDAMVVVGGKQSGNTRRLAEIATNSGVKTLHVETAAELDEDFFRGMERVGLTAGASTPKSIIDMVEQRMRSLAKDSDNH